MRRRRSVAVIAVALLLGGAAFWALAPPAAAEVSGPCTGTLNGVDANQLSSPDTALEVPADGTVDILYVSSGAITGHEVSLEFAGRSWVVDEAADDGNSWSGTVAVADYSKYGVGIYKVNAVTYGDSICTGSAYVKVTGRNPLTTAAGAAAAAAGAVGVIGVAGVAASTARGPKPDFLDGVMNDVARVPLPARQPTFEEQVERTVDTYARCLGCWKTIPLALLRTSAYMLVGAGGVGAPVPIVRWSPFISVAAVVFSLLGGLGSLVLAQQFAVVYPSLAVTISWFVAWLAVGVIVPSLTRLIGVRKANRMVAEVAARYGL